MLHGFFSFSPPLFSSAKPTWSWPIFFPRGCLPSPLRAGPPDSPRPGSPSAYEIIFETYPYLVAVKSIKEEDKYNASLLSKNNRYHC